MLAHRRRHRVRVLEQARKDRAIRVDDRILAIEHVERGRPVVGVDDRLHAVPEVIDAIAAEQIVPRVRKRVRRRERVHHPRQPPIVADDDVRIRIEGEEWRERLNAFAHIAPHHQPALHRHIVAERQLRDVAAIDGDEQAAEESAEHDAAAAFVRRQAVGLALWIVEFLLARLHVHVGVRQLAEIDLGARHLDARNRAAHGHVAQDERRQALRREAGHRIHRHAVAVRVDQLFVDPVAAALRQLVDAELARRQHHLTYRAVDRVAVDVDVGKIVVGANLLDLAQRVLQRAPVPQPDVLDRRAIPFEVGRLDARFGRERTLLEAMQPEGLPRHLDVVRDVRPLAHELVRLDDEAGDVPPEDADDEIAGAGRNDRRDQPAQPRRRHRVDERDRRADDECDRQDEQAGDRHVGVRVGDAGEDRVVDQEPIESPQVHARRQDHEEQREGDRQAAPGASPGGGSPAAQHPRPAGDRDEESGDAARDHRQRHQPAGDQVPRRQREQVKGDRLVEDRIDGRVVADAGAIPVQRQRRPLGHHAGAGRDRDQERGDDRDPAHHGLDRQRERLTVDQNPAARDVVEPIGLDGEKRAVEDEKREEREAAEDRRLEPERPPEDVAVPERIEPQRVDVVRQRCSGAQEDDADGGGQEPQTAPARRSRQPRRRPVNDGAVSTVHLQDFNPS